MKSYIAGVSAIRWLVSPRDNASPVLQYGLRPINGGALDWFDVDTEVATPTPSPTKAAADTERVRVPLTEEQIEHLYDTRVGDATESLPIVYADWVNFARAIEAAHGIAAASGDVGAEV